MRFTIILAVAVLLTPAALTAILGHVRRHQIRESA